MAEGDEPPSTDIGPSGDNVSEGKSAIQEQTEAPSVEQVENDEIEKVDATSEHEDAEKKSNNDEDNSENGEGNESEDVEMLKQELSKIEVSPPIIEPKEEFDDSEFPETYKENTKKEKLAQQYAENFRRQYVHLYRDRKPLLLIPVNECGIEKLVCTTIRPTELPYPELYNWDGASEFVADYLNLTSLEPPTDLPKRMLSPTTVLKLQKGNCFEYSMLLASLLIGAGYDAYVVNGYASREVCQMDETREVCPILKKKVEAVKEEVKAEKKKYMVKPPRDLKSKFEIKMAKREVAEQQQEKEKRLKEDEVAEEEKYKPRPDPLHGLRIHSWVLILSGKREVPESFFVEPLTGVSHPLTSPGYLGIESLWNHHNYWVNMQDCSEGCKNLKYDLGDCSQWEFMFPSNDKPQLLIPDVEEDQYDVELDDEEKVDDVEKHLDVPPSWVKPVEISLHDYQMRCPNGKKSKVYKRAKLEKFAPYLMPDGLVNRLSVYSDRELTDLSTVREYYQNRNDKLQQRLHNHKNGEVTEFFTNDRSQHLKEHVYKAATPGPESERTMVFYHDARVDGLEKREETSTEMTEHFINREDFLYYRNIVFGKRPKKFGPQDETVHRPILKITERFHRNPKVPADENVAECAFLISEEKIQLTYHTKDINISASTREFIKPQNADEKGAILLMSQDMHSTYQVEQTLQQKKQVEIYQLLLKLIDLEDQSRGKVRESEQEVNDILSARIKEEAASELEVSVYDVARNEKARQQRRELELRLIEEKKRKHEMEIDYLAPFLAQMGDPEKLTRAQAYKLKEDCLADLKTRLIDKANLIQARFEKETQELQNKQQWYQQHQVSMSKEDEDEYLNYCSEAMFRIHILELRLNRHKEMAPHKYMSLEQKLRSDERLSEFL